MKFRFKAFGLHLLGSATALTLVLGALYLGWYHWPGWYLSEALHVILLMVGVDVVLGPLLTLIVANSKKSFRELGEGHRDHRHGSTGRSPLWSDNALERPAAVLRFLDGLSRDRTGLGHRCRSSQGERQAGIGPGPALVQPTPLDLGTSAEEHG